MLYMYHVHVIVYANKDDDDYYYYYKWNCIVALTVFICILQRHLIEYHTIN